MKHVCVILAAGLGTRMKSPIPKVLHRLYGIPMLQYVIDVASRLKNAEIVIVVSKNHDTIKNSIRLPAKTLFGVQKKPMGTAHALLCGLKGLKGFKGTVVILNGDMPLITSRTLKKFLVMHKKHKNALSVASFITKDPCSYGRIIRDRAGNAVRIAEITDATQEERAIKEVNSGLYAIESENLLVLGKIKMNRVKGEYYLTDIFEATLKSGQKTGVYCMEDESEFIGINTRYDLLKAHGVLRKRKILSCLESGVNFIDMDSVFIHPDVTIGRETLIYPDVCLEGRTKIGDGCTIYPNVRIEDSTVGDRAVIKDSTVVEQSVIGDEAQVGPFAHIRPQSRISASAKIGNFVEIKKSKIGSGTKAMHLSYIGDATVGKAVNIGAGTITCNYDGMKKHRTVIEDNVFVGSDSQLIAPVRLKKGSYIGAGSTITEDVPRNSLAVSRTKQRNIRGWKKRKLKG